MNIGLQFTKVTKNVLHLMNTGCAIFNYICIVLEVGCK